jgi:solute carrier family 25 protein 44
MSESDEPRLKYDIEWAMLDKSRYIPLSLLSTFVVRSLLYPFTLVRTRLQVQIQSSIYKGTWHALTTTVRYDGIRSLYKGFLVYNCQLLPGLIYITTFESTRAQANRLTKNEYLRAGIGGAVGSLCSQVLACPIDIISQHMQLVGLTSPVRKIRSKDGISSVSDANLSTSASHRLQQRQIRRIHVPKEIRANNYLIFKHICRTLLYEKIDDKNRQTKFSLKGFYRGYFISTFLLIFNFLFSANLFPLPILVIQCLAGPLSSLTSTILTNPLDVCRTRIQVSQERRQVLQILRELWQEERLNIFKKGLTARLSHSCIYSLFIIFGYETVKRISLKEEYKEHMRW